jgi:hypothetical protein
MASPLEHALEKLSFHYSNDATWVMTNLGPAATRYPLITRKKEARTYISSLPL